MTWISDAEDEAFVIENEWDVAIPVSFTVIDGICEMHTYPSVEKAVRAVYETYKDDLFSDAALSALWDAVEPFFAENGYAHDRFRDRWGYVFRGTASSDATARLLTCEDEDKNLTTYDIEMTLLDGRGAFGVEADGKIVSLAVTHAPTDCGVNILEVGVETAKDYRGRGYAQASLRALSAALAEKGIMTEYRCQRYNTASYRVAKSAGLSLCGKYYYYVGRKE